MGFWSKFLSLTGSMSVIAGMVLGLACPATAPFAIAGLVGGALELTVGNAMS